MQTGLFARDTGKGIKMAIWELINPSDKYTFEADSPIVACIVATILSGSYSAKQIDPKPENEVSVGMLSFIDNPEAFFKETYGISLDDAMDKYIKQIKKSFESFVIGDRKEYITILSFITSSTQQNIFREWWNDRKRSSINNIGKQAADYAKQLGEKIEKLSNTNHGNVFQHMIINRLKTLRVDPWMRSPLGDYYEGLKEEIFRHTVSLGEHHYDGRIFIINSLPGHQGSGGMSMGSPESYHLTLVGG